MGTNLFVDFPTKIASVNPLDSVFTNGPYLVLSHIVAGLLLGLLAISAVVLAALAKNRPLVLLSVCGLGTILFAGESGIEFVLGWYSEDLFSFLMSLGFILSFANYFVILWYTQIKGS